mgnify:CR=1 FL=1
MLPDLCRWAKLCALDHAAEADDYRSWTLGGGCEQWGAAFWAERLDPTTSALHHCVVLGFAAEIELTDGHFDHCPERCTRHDLAVGAVANRHSRGIDLRSE